MKTFNSICLILLCVGNAFSQAQMGSETSTGRCWIRPARFCPGLR